MRSLFYQNRKFIVATLCSVAIAFFALSMLFGVRSSVSAETVSDQFNEGDYVSQTAFVDDYGNSGFAVFARDDGQIVNFRKDFKGVFETSFVAIKATNGGIGTTLVDFIFSADNGKRFTLSIKRNGSDSFAYVTYADKMMGIESLMSGYTSMTNRAGTFPSVKSKDRYTVVFDPSTMTVYVNDKLIWDFSKPVNDGYYVGFTIERFASYQVSVVMSRSSGENGLSFYSLCGEDLSGQVIRDNGKPSFFVDKKADAVKGSSYQIPAAAAFDYVDGAINNYTVDCLAPDGSIVYSGKATGTQSFDVEKAGDYSLVYYATDSKGNTGAYTMAVTAYENDDLDVSLNGDLVSAAPMNSSATIPVGFIQSKLLCYDIDPLAERHVYNNGQELTALSGKDNEAVTLNIDKNSTYTVKYSYKKHGIDFEKTYEIAVSAAGYEDFVLQSEYASGKAFAMPQVYYIDGANKKKATAVLTYPSGKQASTDCVFDEVGEYLLYYTCSGKANSQVKTFMVSYAPSDLFEVEYGSVTDARSYIHDDLVGVQVALTAAGTLTYKNVIDFSEKGKNDYFIELIATPTEYFSVDFGTFLIRLTDTEDPNNWVEIKAFDMASNRADGTYVRARRNGTPYVSTNGVGSTFKPTAAGYGGYPILHSFRGSASRTDLTKETIKFAFDPNDRCLYSDSNGMDPVKNYHRLVADLCDPTWCGEWNGFTNNTAYLSISCTAINTIANFMILSVDGNDLSDYTVTPSRDPVITISSVEENNMPYAVAGKQYAIPSAYATDAFNRLLDINVEVYENYKAEGERKMTVANGAFTPDKAGNYSIRYSTCDYYGNAMEKVVNITAYASNAYSNTLKFGYEATEPEKFNNLVVGKYLALTKIEWYGGAGYLQTSVKVVDPDGADCQPFEYKGETVVMANKSGLYTVTYTVKDYLQMTETYTESKNVKNGNGPVLAEDIELPEVLIEGVNYRMPTPKAYFQSTGGYISPSIQITDGNGSYTLTSDVYTPKLAANANTVKIVYSYGGMQVEKVVSCKSAQLQAGGYDIKEYFTAENGTLSSNADCIEYNTNSAENSLTLNTPVPVAGFELAFDVGRVVENGSGENDEKEKVNVGFSGLDIILSDYLDPYYKVLLSYRKSGDEIKYSINNGTPVSTKGSFTTVSSDTLRFSYSSLTYEFYNIKAAKIGTIKNYLTGETFDGFKSGFVMIKFVLNGVTDSSSIQLFTLNGQPLNYTKYDRIEPVIYTQGDFGGRCTVGDVISTGTASAYDILSGVTDVLVSVKSPSGKYVQSLTNKEIKNLSAATEYKFRCTETGSYEISFVSTDASGRKGTARKLVNVVDETPPSVIVNGSISKSISVGTTLNIPAATVMNGNNCTISIMIYDPDKAIYTTVTNGTYTFNRRGTFIVRYFVFDQFYNCVILDYTVTVS